MKVKFHLIDHRRKKAKSIEGFVTDFAVTPCIYVKANEIKGAKSASLLFAWLWISIGFQLMWVTNE